MINSRALLTSALLTVAGTAHPLDIQFDYTYDSGGFFSDSSRRSVLEAAGGYFESRITDNLLAIGPSGNSSFSGTIFDPGTGGNIITNVQNVAADTIVVFAGARNLGSTALAEGGPGNFSIVNGNINDYASSIYNRGQGETRGSLAVDFAPWGGSIAFDTSSTWYFDSDLSTDDDISGNDFFSVALHELGHMLGYGTADSWDNKVSGGLFNGVNSVAANGGSSVPLSGDAHWQNQLMSPIEGAGSFEVAMDPSIATGTRKVFTDLDFAGLKDIGWELAAVPLPAAIYLFGAGILGLMGFSRRKSSRS